MVVGGLVLSTSIVAFVCDSVSISLTFLRFRRDPTIACYYRIPLAMFPEETTRVSISLKKHYVMKHCFLVKHFS